MWKIEKEDCADLDFAISCLFSEAISLSEFKTWLAIVINEMPIEKIPLYIFDLIDFGVLEIHCQITHANTLYW